MVEEPDYRVPPDAKQPATSVMNPLEEVERALSLLDGRHPEAVRVERETQRALAAKRTKDETKSQAARREQLRRSGKRALVGVGLAGFLAVAGHEYLTRSGRARDVEAALAPMFEPYTSRGFARVSVSRFASESVDLESTEAACYVAVASRSPGDGAVRVDRPNGLLQAEGPVAWCTCGAETSTVRLRDVTSHLGGVAVLRAPVTDVGGPLGLLFLEPRPALLGQIDDCDHEAFDTWVEHGRATRATDEALDEETRLALSREGFTLVGSAPATQPFAVVPAAEGGCFLAWSAAGADVLSLRLQGGARPFGEGQGQPGLIAWCASASHGSTSTVWRTGTGAITVTRVAASRIGGRYGLEEAAPRLGMNATHAWVADEDLAWDASATLQASGILPAETTVSTNGLAVKDARVLAFSASGATVEPMQEKGYTCEPAVSGATPAKKSTVCVQATALPWHATPGVGKAAIAEGPLPFWMDVMRPASDPRALAAELAVVKLGRRLLAEGFEVTTTDGLTEVEGGALLAGRGGRDGVVALQLSYEAPWASACSSRDSREVWTVDGAPVVVSLAAGAQVRLDCSPRAAHEHKTVMFRHVSKPATP